MAREELQSPFLESTIDPWILPLVMALNTDLSVTLGSCQGHEEEGVLDASVDFAVKGLPGIKAVVKGMEKALPLFRKMGFWAEVSINWNPTVATACDFARYPGWVMLYMNIENMEEGKAPKKKMLVALAKCFK